MAVTDAVSDTLNSEPPASSARSRSESLSTTRSYLRRSAGIPSPHEFPYCAGKAWTAAAPRLPSVFSYNPIRHTVDRFLVDEHGCMRQYKTDRVDPYLEPSVKDGIHANRKKGVVEYADLTRLTNPRYNPDYKERLMAESKAFCRITGSFTRLYDVAVRNRENPFRVGR